MPLYIGVDFHPHQQTVAYCNTELGEVKQTTLFHNPEQVRLFYEQLPKAIVGVEASCTARWFEQLMTELGHELQVGNPTLIRARARSRHKSDKRDADLLLDLLLKGEFPALWRRPAEDQSVLEMLRFRHSLVKQRTQVGNRLQALAHAAGLPKRGIRTKRARIALTAARFNDTQSFERDQLFEILDDLSARIKVIEKWLERSSAGRVRTGSISKAGSAVLRHLLGQAVQVASRYDGELKAFYKRLATRRSKSIAKVAATRKLLIRLFIMLRDEIDYAEFKRRGSAVGMPVLSHGL